MADLPVTLVAAPMANGVEDAEPVEFRRVPLVAGAVAAGAEMVGREALKGWAVIHRDQIKGRKNLVAFTVDKVQGTSMLPTIRPGDIVAVDRDDLDPGRYKTPKIFLVRTEDGLTIKRTARRGHLLVLNADNPASGWIPLVLDLNDRDIKELIVGRVVWQFSSDL
ncbi:MAG: S24 family peptidase [Candidatus Alcyoniella australis]|nr:S24 family peptidase [Candidatus Alcyoniella australis]